MKEKQLENKEEITEINTWIKKKLKMYFFKVEQKKLELKSRWEKKCEKLKFYLKEPTLLTY